MLVAGSGYGKTTLLEQWARDGRSVAWFRAGPTPDVAVVARALVAASSHVLPGAGRRLLERLAVTDDPEREAVLLAEMLAEDLDDWPSEAWIIVDDYQHVAASVASEAFVETIVDRSPVRMLIASRVRPSWVRARSILDGEVLEIPQTALAMSSEEVAEVLHGGRIELTSGLVALAGGWPAVVALAGMTPDAPDTDAELPETLFEFFADELYRGLDPVVANGLAILAAMPLVDRELAETILGPERAEHVCGNALTLGIVDERDRRLELHPLMRSFLENRALPGTRHETSGTFLRAWAYYKNRRELDAAFELVEKLGDAADVDRLIVEAMDDLLNGARLPTLESWVERASARVGESPAVLVAQAEVALRQGRHLTAQAVAERIIRGGPMDEAVAFRAYLVGAKAAHVGAREDDALSLYEQAEAAGRSDRERRLARWGLLTAAAALELDMAYELLGELQVRATKGLDPNEAVRTADKHLALGLRFGGISSLAEAKRVSELLPAVPDPFVRCSFRSTFSCALNLAAEYEAALATATEMGRDAGEFRVDFALPYASLMRGAALAGLRRFDQAHDMLGQALGQAVRCTDAFAQQGVYAGRIRAFLHDGRIAEACALEPPDLSDSLPGMRGEVWASRGLALACMGRVAEARQLADESATSTRAVESRVLVHCIQTMVALKTRDPELSNLIRALIAVAFEAGAVDYVVTSYRASPDLLASLLRDPVTAERTGYIIARASDQEVARAIGVDALEALDPVSTLSAREREVYELLCDGLSNAAIAKRLFISESTVKVHVHHVFDKLGIRSRTALALNAVSRRSQAAPAIEDGSTDSASEG
jgi:DNA-binding CsgD family transcriptional regulator